MNEGMIRIPRQTLKCPRCENKLVTEIPSMMGYDLVWVFGTCWRQNLYQNQITII